MRTTAAILVAAATTLALGVSACGADDDVASTRPSAGSPEAMLRTGTPEPPPSGEPRDSTPEATVSDNATGDHETPAPTPTERRTPKEVTPEPSPTPDSPDPSGPPVTGEVPADYLDEVLADAAGRSDADEVEVIRARAVQWSDGSLGCPEPGKMYTQALVDGYQVEVRAGDRVYDYRLDHNGAFKLCTSPAPAPPPADDRW
ncbi:hypothetical protein EF847_19530 [Actinobacteria bacterium YIM 96077]|uniref:Uncharacterized protein n=1 Tax=Phytoactinopolyspora halophila TaxID=1981511 RepID=A0A329QNW8_9ACTN|nr:hypothetical protein [Phytoactinopolyspora halophila]AYY14560.1 hypothetical protein EF847_19530 [Actinobacteria bacterium YIM 96077]RAW14064.1 hypothetical protein DPM12_11605 [Phytoactinopolyspora halophila]